MTMLINGREATFLEKLRHEANDLREITAHLTNDRGMTKAQIEQYVFERNAMNGPVQRDFLAFDGTEKGITKMMVIWALNMATEGSRS